MGFNTQTNRSAGIEDDAMKTLNWEPKTYSNLFGDDDDIKFIGLSFLINNNL